MADSVNHSETIISLYCAREKTLHLNNTHCEAVNFNEILLPLKIHRRDGFGLLHGKPFYLHFLPISHEIGRIHHHGFFIQVDMFWDWQQKTHMALITSLQAPTTTFKRQNEKFELLNRCS